jgi:hypothetical protein
MWFDAAAVPLGPLPEMRDYLACRWQMGKGM